MVVGNNAAMSTTLMRKIGLGVVGMALSAAPVQAQLDETAQSCTPLTYVLKVLPSSGFAKMKLNAAVNDSGVLKLDTSKSYDAQKLDVTGRIRPTGNALKIDWQITGDANQRGAR